MHWVVAFNGARDGYQVPLALAETDRLEALVTDWYSPLDRAPVAALAARLPARVRQLFERRYRAGLPSSKVHVLLREAVRQVVQRDALALVDSRLGAYAGRLARARGAGVLAYSFYGHAAFAAYGSESGARLLFQVQAHPRTMRAVLQEELENAPDRLARASIASESALLGMFPRFEQLCEEPLLADRCLVPSTYTRATLVDNGVAADRIQVIPYGVDLEQFTPPDRPPADERFRVLFAGNLVRRKGLGYLLEAWKRLALPNSELLLVGRGKVDADLLARYRGWYRTVMDVHERGRMRELYGTAHVCCMPTLSDSFGLVFLEALACGTPIIGTPNSGAADLVSQEEGGFLVPIQSVPALMERLSWCYEHRDALLAMRAQARRRAERFSWAEFRCAVAAAAEVAGTL